MFTSGKFLSVELWKSEKGAHVMKLGRPFDYYDRREIIHLIFVQTEKHKLGVSIATRTWKNGQRYTVKSKHVLIHNAGSLDWSEF